MRPEMLVPLSRPEILESLELISERDAALAEVLDSLDCMMRRIVDHVEKTEKLIESGQAALDDFSSSPVLSMITPMFGGLLGGK